MLLRTILNTKNVPNLEWSKTFTGYGTVHAATVPDKALVLAVTKWMLYGEETPLVGVGLVYKPHYISTEPFCATYMHLHVWHAVGSSVESVDKLNLSCLIFVNVSEMSDVIPVATQHPILLDVATKDTMTRTGKPMAPLSFRGFRLHTVWTRQSGGDLVHQVAFPRFPGETTTSMLEYEPERLLTRTLTWLSAMCGNTLTSSSSVEVATLRVSSMDRLCTST